MSTHYHNARTRRRVPPFKENDQQKARVLDLIDRAGYPHIDIIVRVRGAVAEAARDRSLLSFCETYDVPPGIVEQILQAFAAGRDYTITHLATETIISRHTGV
jgi:hypothetical protein